MADKKDLGLKVEIKLPAKVEAKLDNKILRIKGPKGEVTRDVFDPKMKVEVANDAVVLSTETTKRNKTMIYAYNAHIKNMVTGVTEGHKYVLKICAGHFPMTVAVQSNQIIIKNFLGEKFPRTLAIKPGCTVKVEGDKVNVESPDKEIAGTVASDIEKATRRPGFDQRIFQDGLYIISKDGKDIK